MRHKQPSKSASAARAPVTISHTHDSADTLKMERVLLFTDAIFAIIMTLLALEVRLPAQAQLGSTESVLDALVETVPNFAAYALSFVVIAMMWNTHLRRYRYLVAVNGNVIAGIVLQLLFVGLIPFATSMIARSAAPMVVTFYAGVLLVNVIIGWIAWLVASATPALVSVALTPAVRRESNWRSGSTAFIFAASMVLAWVWPVWAMLSWALQIPANRLIHKYFAKSTPGGSPQNQST